MKFLVGAIVVAYVSLRNVTMRVALHYLLHPHQWKALSSMSEHGVLHTARHHALVPYGFRRPVRWTTDAPTCPFSKRDALPVNVIEMLTRHDAFGRRRGTSLFIESGSTERRAPRKRMYLSGLTTEAVEEYASHMTRLSGAVVNGCDDALDLTCRLTFLIHFNREPSQREARALRTMADALTHSLNHPFHSHISSAKRVLRDAVEHTTGGMTHRWIDAGMSREDAYVELAHNVFGMTLQWAYLIRRLSLSTDAVSTLEDAAHFVLDDLPAKVAASRVDGALVLHDLDERCKGAQRPVTFQPPSRRSEHIVHDDQPIASETDTHYVPFGYSARRCPGEWLTYTMLRTLRVTSDGTSEAATRMGLNMCHGGACDEGCDTPP